LKQVGVASQREIEKTVARRDRITGDEKPEARLVPTIGSIDASHGGGQIELE